MKNFSYDAPVRFHSTTMKKITDCDLISWVYHRDEKWSKCVWNGGDRILLSYVEVPDARWRQIEDAAIVMSTENVGPKVYDIRDGTNDEWNKHCSIVSGFVKTIRIIETELLRKVVVPVKRVVLDVVNRLHEAGLQHGDVYGNVMANEADEPRLIDYDTVHKIGTKPPLLLANLLEAFQRDENDVRAIDADDALEMCRHFSQSI